MGGRTQTTLKRFLLATTVVLLAFTFVGADDAWTRSLGREDHVAYIVIDQLRSGRDTPQVFPNDFNLPFSTFYEELKWRPNECWAGSTLKESISAYCLPHARLAKYYPNFRDPSEKTLNTMGSCAGLYVWYNSQENKYYFWSFCWNVSGVLGPFIGDPRVELSQAVKPRRGHRTLPGVTITMVSQRWLYPNPEDARVPLDECYDCAHGHLSGRTIEALRLNSFITRIRLANHGPTDIYYQAERGAADKPAVCPLLSPDNGDWHQALRTDYQCDIGSDTWTKLARGKEVEFEKRDQAFAKGVVGVVVVLNEAPTYWDPSKLMVTYAALYGRN